MRIHETIKIMCLRWVIMEIISFSFHSLSSLWTAPVVLSTGASPRDPTPPLLGACVLRRCRESMAPHYPVHPVGGALAAWGDPTAASPQADQDQWRWGCPPSSCRRPRAQLSRKRPEETAQWAGGDAQWAQAGPSGRAVVSSQCFCFWNSSGGSLSILLVFCRSQFGMLPIYLFCFSGFNFIHCNYLLFSCYLHWN